MDNVFFTLSIVLLANIINEWNNLNKYKFIKLGVEKLMDYDVLILGGGIIGCAVAYELSKYNLNIAVIEKDFDIADDISFFNTSIVYDGCECKDNLISALEEMGNSMLSSITKNCPFLLMRLFYVI